MSIQINNEQNDDEEFDYEKDYETDIDSDGNLKTDSDSEFYSESDTDINSDEPYSEYSDESEDENMQNLQDDLIDINNNDNDSSENDSSENDSSEKIIKEIIYYQNTTHNLLQKKAFKLLCYEVLQDYKTDFKLSKNAINAIQECAEDYLIDMFNKTNKLTVLGKRKTVDCKQINFINRMMQ